MPEKPIEANPLWQPMPVIVPRHEHRELSPNEKVAAAVAYIRSRYLKHGRATAGGHSEREERVPGE